MSKMTIGIPEHDTKLLHQLGRLAIAHGNLEMVQIYCLKIIEKMSPKDALKTYRKKGARDIRKLILKAAKKPSLNSTERLAVEKMITEAKGLSEKRNDFLHCFWGRTSTGKWKRSPDEHKWKALPTASEIAVLVKDIQTLTNKLNKSRLSGEIRKISS